MAIRQVRTIGDDILRKECKPVKEITPRIAELIEDMFETMYEANGVGLAAPQVGVLKQIVVMDVDDGNQYVLINPEIIEQSGSQTGQEGCLSVPGKAGMVTRPNHVVVRAYDENMEQFELEGEELLARCICHECAHLHGQLYVDLVEGELMDTTAEPEEEAVQMELELDAAEPVAEEAETQEVYEESEEAEDAADSEDTVATEALEEEVPTEEAEPYTEPEEVLEAAEEVIPEEVSEPVYTEETADIAEVQADDTVYEEQPACTEQPVDAEAAYQEQPADEENQTEADQTEEPAAEEVHEEKHSPFSKLTKLITPKKEKKSSGWPQDFQPIKRREDIDEDLVNGDVNPYTGHEYRTNSVRMHPHRIGYVQVYDRKDHKWTDMTEWAFLGVEERKKATMGKDYEPPIYLD